MKLKIFICSVIFIIAGSVAGISPVFLHQVVDGSSCCDTLTFVGDPGDTESFECATAGHGCTSDMTVADFEDPSIVTTNNAGGWDGGFARIAFSTDGNEEDNFIQWDITADDQFSVSLEMKIPDLATDNGRLFFVVNSSTGYLGVQLYVEDVSGNEFLCIANDVPQNDCYDATTGSVYRLELEYTKNAATPCVIYNDADEVVGTISITAEDKTIKYIKLGGNASDTTAATLDYDNVRYKAAGGGF